MNEDVENEMENIAKRLERRLPEVWAERYSGKNVPRFKVTAVPKKEIPFSKPEGGYVRVEWKNVVYKVLYSSWTGKVSVWGPGNIKEGMVYAALRGVYRFEDM